MSKKQPTGINTARQALLKLGRSSVKASRKKAAAQRDGELVAKWRALAKAGLIQSKTSPAQSRLTRSRIASINRAFNQLQRAGHYENGRVNHPLQKETYQTPSGKSRTRYIFSENFKFLKSDKKVKETRGVIKTKKGYIVEKSKDARIWIDKHGTLKFKKNGIIWSANEFTGEGILELYRMIKEGEIKLGSKHFITWMPFGNQSPRNEVNNDEFIRTIDQYVREMNPKTWNDYMEFTTFHFGTWGK